MSPKPFVFHPEAIAEVQAARDWYRRRSPSASKAFLAQLARGFRRVALNPKAWQAYPNGDRRFVLHRYPYIIVYREQERFIEIIAVAHGHQEPGYWRTRSD